MHNGITLHHDRQIFVDNLKTSCIHTGKTIESFHEQKLKNIKKELVKKALKKYTKITTCGQHCFQIMNNKMLFYFNIDDNSTKIVSERIRAS